MTRRFGLTVATVSLTLLAVAAWLVAGARAVGRAFADLMNGGEA